MDPRRLPGPLGSPALHQDSQLKAVSKLTILHPRPQSSLLPVSPQTSITLRRGGNIRSPALGSGGGGVSKGAFGSKTPSLLGVSGI